MAIAVLSVVGLSSAAVGAQQLTATPTLPSVPVKVTNTTPVPVSPQGVTTVAGSVEITSIPGVRVETMPQVGIDPLSNIVQLANSAQAPIIVRNADAPGLETPSQSERLGDFRLLKSQRFHYMSYRRESGSS